MQATGNIAESTQQWNNSPKWWGFECRCSCTAFSEQEKRTIRENYMVNYVCDHLQSALEGSVDPTKYCTAEVTSAAADQRMPLQDIAIPRRINNPPPSDHKKVTIPGLAEDHFMSEFLCRSQPSATKVQIDSQSGDFDIHWKVRGRGDAFYKLRAAGNIVELEKSDVAQQWWGFSVSCNCPNFLRQRHRCDASGWTENYVCQHLGMALENAIDKTYISYDDDSSSVNATFLVDS
jgi:predicted SprT family Zn-dependent metalloprotease